jgi:hypothetical protein
MRVVRSIAVTALISVSLGACAMRPPEATADMWQSDRKPPKWIEFHTVTESRAYGRLMMVLYDGAAADLKDQDFYSSIPVFALAAASAAMLAFGTDKETAAGVALGAAGLEIGRRQLSFGDRAGVLAAGIQSWKCFKDAAQSVAFYDDLNKKPNFLAEFSSLKELMKGADNLLTGRPPATLSENQLLSSLRQARDAAETAKNLAEQTIQAEEGLLDAFNDERFAIESSIRLKYTGMLKPFEASAGRQMVLDSLRQLAADQAATSDIHRSFTGSSAQANAVKLQMLEANVSHKFIDTNDNIPELITKLKTSAETFTESKAKAYRELKTVLTACPR